MFYGFDKLPDEYIISETQYIKQNEWNIKRYNLTNDWDKHICKLERHAEIPKIYKDGEITIVFIDNVLNFSKLSKVNKYTLSSNELLEKKVLFTDDGIKFYQFYIVK